MPTRKLYVEHPYIFPTMFVCAKHVKIQENNNGKGFQSGEVRNFIQELI